jgi:hypothetical protein
MKARELWKWVPAMLVGCTVSLAFAKLPAPPSADPAKAAEAKQKAAEAAKKGAEALAKAQDRAVERYKKEKGLVLVSTPAKPGAPVKPAAPAAKPAAAPAKK